eukprot:CAMPEP_0114557178 /NCGR_PEP_ID=MMETSP0114-20121206/9689_1 /TAXON_ID=31324 /ORGANISM="Goniomonas sp, Strain m" /LENGTH=282 /DNA_ID=CAMNT_0001742443 /DNA_START=156 /DNA_END=1001 /DNA_ORIENTATION=-
MEQRSRRRRLNREAGRPDTPPSPNIYRRSVPGYSGYVPSVESECLVGHNFSTTISQVKEIEDTRAAGTVKPYRPEKLDTISYRNCIPGYSGYIPCAEHTVGYNFKESIRAATRLHDARRYETQRRPSSAAASTAFSETAGQKADRRKSETSDRDRRRKSETSDRRPSTDSNARPPSPKVRLRPPTPPIRRAVLQQPDEVEAGRTEVGQRPAKPGRTRLRPASAMAVLMRERERESRPSVGHTNCLASVLRPQTAFRRPATRCESPMSAWRATAAKLRSSEGT